MYNVMYTKISIIVLEKGGCCMRILVLGAGGVGGFFGGRLVEKEKMLHFSFAKQKKTAIRRKRPCYS